MKLRDVLDPRFAVAALAVASAILMPARPRAEDGEAVFVLHRGTDTLSIRVSDIESAGMERIPGGPFRVAFCLKDARVENYVRFHLDHGRMPAVVTPPTGSMGRTDPWAGTYFGCIRITGFTAEEARDLVRSLVREPGPRRKPYCPERDFVELCLDPRTNPRTDLPAIAAAAAERGWRVRETHANVPDGPDRTQRVDELFLHKGGLRRFVFIQRRYTGWTNLVCAHVVAPPPAADTPAPCDGAFAPIDEALPPGEPRKTAADGEGGQGHLWSRNGNGRRLGVVVRLDARGRIVQMFTDRYWRPEPE